MAVLASKATYPSSLGMGSNQPSVVSQYAVNYRKPLANGDMHNGAPFLSPTESEFSENNDGPEPIRSWDEKRVGEWLRGINCGQYEQIFKGKSWFCNGEIHAGISLLFCPTFYSHLPQ